MPQTNHLMSCEKLFHGSLLSILTVLANRTSIRSGHSVTQKWDPLRYLFCMGSWSTSYHRHLGSPLWGIATALFFFEAVPRIMTSIHVPGEGDPPSIMFWGKYTLRRMLLESVGICRAESRITRLLSPAWCISYPLYICSAMRTLYVLFISSREQIPFLEVLNYTLTLEGADSLPRDAHYN